jgi:hypothetical protein
MDHQILPLKGKFVVFYDAEKNDILVKQLLAAVISEPGTVYGEGTIRAVHLTFERERGVVAIADYGKPVLGFCETSQVLREDWEAEVEKWRKEHDPHCQEAEKDAE